MLGKLLLFFTINGLNIKGYISENTVYIHDKIYGPYDNPPVMWVSNGKRDLKLMFLVIRGNTFAFNYYKGKKGFVNVNDRIYGPFGIVYRIEVSHDGNSWGFVYSKQGEVFKKYYIRVNKDTFGPFSDAWGPFFSDDGKHFAFRYIKDSMEYIQIDNKVFGPYASLYKSYPRNPATIDMPGDSVPHTPLNYMEIFYINDDFNPMAEEENHSIDPMLNDALAIRFSKKDNQFVFVYRKGSGTLPCGKGSFYVKTAKNTFGPYRVVAPLWLSGGDLIIIEEDCPGFCCGEPEKRRFRVYLNGLFVKTIQGKEQFYITTSTEEILEEPDTSYNLPDWLKGHLILETPMGIVIDWILLPYTTLKDINNLTQKDLLQKGRIFFDFQQMTQGERAEIIRKFADSININIPDMSGWTMLHRAAWDGNLNLVEYLVSLGAKITYTVKNALQEAGAKATGKYLNWSVFNIAAYKGHREVLKLLVQQAINSKLFTFKSFDDKTLLHFAAFDGDTTQLNELLLHGININSKDKYGMTPLHLASFGNNYDAVRFLIEHGADRNAENKSGKTPCNFAKSDRIKQLLQCK